MPVKHVTICTAMRATCDPLTATLPAFLMVGMIQFTDQSVQIVGNTPIVRHTLTGETERDGKTNPVGSCSAPHVSSGHERRAVAAVVVQLKLPGGSVTQG
jgi:hypothetical protein